MKASVYIGTSLDGFIAREDGGLDWLTGYADQDAVDSYNDFMSGIDSIVVGRGTFETVMTFPAWPYDRPVFVLSNSLDKLHADVAEKTRLLAMPPREVLDHLASLGFAHAYIDGGKVIQAFLREDLIDHLIIATVPVLIGSGIPLFGPLSRDLAFSHIRTTTAPNGLVRSYYERGPEISRVN
jgi:dihydrofolate reductase